MKVAITGAAGFVGSNLVPYLQERELEVLSFSRTQSFDYHSLDATYVDKYSIDALVHLAGKAHDLRKSVDANAYFEANTFLTQRLFDAFLRSQASVFIYISSVKAVTDHAIVPLKEDVLAHPATDYGRSKHAAEQYINAQVLPNGKRVYILRPCMIHGPGNKGNLNLLYKLVSKGIPYPLAAFENSRSFLSVENLCFVVFELLTRPDIAGGTFHLSDDGVLSTNKIVQLMSETLHKRPKLMRLPVALVKMLAAIGDFLPFPINSERLQKLTENYLVDNQKIKLALGKSLPVDVTTGIQKTLASFKYDH